jgi:Tfp pilus assembly protein PilN
MKVSLNLSLAQSFRQRHVVAWSVPLLLVSFLLLFRLVLSIQANWREYRTVRQSVEREQSRLNELAGQEAGLKGKLEQPENRALLREVQFVNSVIEQRRLSFTGLTEKVTVLLPPQVRLAALSLPDSSGDPVVHFGIEGTSEEPVETFLTNLEDSPDFRDVSLLSQGFEEKGNGAPVSITCTARYVGGRSEAVEALNTAEDEKGTAAAAGHQSQTAPPGVSAPAPEKSTGAPVPVAASAKRPAKIVTPVPRSVTPGPAKAK